MTRPAPAGLEDALSRLWSLHPIDPNVLFKTPAFVCLRAICQDSYANTGWEQTLNFALLYALHSLGLPCLQPLTPTSTLSVPEVARALDRAFRLESVVWTHLCPINLASDLPPLKFGPAELRHFSSKELHNLFGWEQLTRHYPSGLPDLSDLSQFQWLVVSETRRTESTASARALPAFESILSAPDPARIDPHTNQLPTAVERALLFLLLAPWEDWAEMPGIDWRGFTMPWVYSRCDDLFVRPPLPRSAHSLSWEPRMGTNRFGEEVEWEAPVELPLRDTVAQLPGILSKTAWADLQAALRSPLFETPVAHFLVRAYLADGIDEFLAHLTTLEAALGTKRDYLPRPKADPHKHLGGATQRMAARISGLLGSPDHGKMYSRLFDQRSAFLHGRPVQSISVDDRISARRLARRVIQKLIEVAEASAIGSREDWLGTLLAKGARSQTPR